MNNKNVNFFEKNVEKIVLAVAAAGAAYLVYLAFLPVELVSDDGSQSTPVTKIEDNIADQVKDLQQKQSTNIPARITWHVPDFVSKYKIVMQSQPLPREIVQSDHFPHIGPYQVPAGQPGLNAIGGMQVVTPNPVAPSEVTAKSDRQMVAVTPTATPGPGATPAAADVRDQAWVEIDGLLDLSAMFAQMSDPKLKNNERLDAAHQKVVVAQIQVQRRALTGPGTWSNWEDVPAGGMPPSPPLQVPKDSSDWAALTADQVTQLISQLDQRKADILQPSYYPVVAPGTVAPTVPGRPVAATPPAGGANPPQQDLHPVDNMIDSGPIVSTPAPVQTPPPGAAPKAPDAPVPFRFFDDTAKGGTTYQYRVRAAYINPTYRYPNGLKDQSKKDEPLLVSDWKDATPTGQTAQPDIGALAVQDNMYFYVIGAAGMGGGKIPAANVRVYKRIDGKWYDNSWPVSAGMPLSGPIRLVDQPKMPAQQVDTDFTIVDVLPGADSETVILRSADGRLSTRTSKIDSDAMSKQGWDKIVEKPAPPPASTRPRPTPQRTTPPAGRPGTPTPPGVDNLL